MIFNFLERKSNVYYQNVQQSELLPFWFILSNVNKSPIPQITKSPIPQITKSTNLDLFLPDKIAAKT
jgi:hypothetical protein